MLLSPVPKLAPIQFNGTLPVPNKYTQSWAVFYHCCFPLAVSWQATLVGTVSSNIGAQIFLKLVLAVYISLDSHSVVLSLSNKTPCFPVYPPCQKSSKKQIFSIMLEIFG